MNFIVKLFRSLWYLLWYLFAATVVLVAALFGLARLLLPLVDDYNRDVERYATELAGRPIKIMSLDAEWHGFSPSLVLNNVRLLSRDGSNTILHLSRARLDFDLLAIASTKQVQFKRFALSGADVSLVRQESGQVNLSGFETSQIETDGDDDTAAILQWLLKQGEISLHARNLIYQDNKRNQKRFHFSNLSFVLRNQGDRHLIDGAIGFPEKNNQEFAFALDIVGDITRGTNWSGKVYVSGTNLDITRIFGVLGSNGHRVNIGNSNFEIWTDWRQAELISLQGDLALEKVIWRSEQQFTPLLQPLLQDKASAPDSIAVERDGASVTEYRNIIGRFMWDKYDEGWQLIADNFVMARDSRIWPSTQFAVHYFKDKTASHQFNFRSNMVRTEDLSPLVPILFGKYKGYASFVDRLAPEGDIKNVNFSWAEAENDFHLAARLDGVGFSSMDKLPGITGLAGELRSTKQGGSLFLKTLGSEFSMPSMFRWDIPIKRLRGQFDWSIDDNSITVSSRDIELATAHIETMAVIDLQIPRTKGAPFLSLIVNFKNGDASKASYYYPVPYLQKTIKWLDPAIVQGNVVSGGAIVYGPLDQFPFTKGQGVFETRFELENGILDYAEDWPKIHDLDANVLFRGNSLVVTADHGKIFDSELSSVRVDIPKLGKRPLDINIEGRVSGTSQEKLNYLMVSPPLNRKYGQYLTGLTASGDSDLDLKIDLKIKPIVESKVIGKLFVKDNALELEGFPKLLTNINGVLDISERGLSAKSVKADLLEQSSNLSVKTRSNKKKPGQQDLVFKVDGVFDAKHLTAGQFPVMKDLVDGKSAWNVELKIPIDGPDKPKRNVMLRVASSLKGTEVKLPPPFRKNMADVRQFRFFMNIKNAEKALIKAEYAGDFEGIFECDFDSPYWVTRGEARFGGGPVVLPRSDGLRIVGSMKELSVDIWTNLFKQLSAQLASEEPVIDKSTTDQTEQLPPHLAMIHSVELLVNKFIFLGQQATDLKLLVSKKEDWLNIDVDSKEMLGSVTVPSDLDKQRLILDMKHLHVRTPDTPGGKVDPREMPAINFNSRFVAYDNKQLGSVAFETSKTEKGVLLEQLIINPRETMIKGHGHWLIDQGVHQSLLEFELESDDLGKTMKDFGYVETIEEGEGKIIAKLQWPSTIFDPDFSHLSGEVELNFRNGRILDIEPGRAARIFGLFSIQTLPRRLTLDFSDMFAKGLSFDFVTGNFRLEEGDAYTNNFKLLGTSADIALKGRIGLGAQDYDQKVRVTPHITDAAVLLSILTAQPLIIVLQQMLKADIEGAASIEYLLTGTWDNYNLTPVIQQPLFDDEVDEF